MRNSISIVFRVDADEQLGLGHLSRCRSLMLALAGTAPCKFVFVTNNHDLVRKFLPQVDIDLYAVADVERVGHADVVIIDVPGIVHREEKGLRRLADLIVVIDDDGPGLQYQDILVRPNLLNLDLPAGMQLDNYWSGRDYIILHPDFKSLASQPRNRENKTKKLFVCFGGSDPGGLTLRVIPLLKQLKQDTTIQIVQGAAFVQMQTVIDETEDDGRFEVCRNVPDMAKKIRQANVALISGGSLLYEACALGVPAVVVSQNESQVIEARICAAGGGAIDLGDRRKVTDEEILGALHKLLVDESFRQSMTRKGPEIVSPDGAMHIASKLLLRVRKEVVL